jgi:hypothetical protein
MNWGCLGSIAFLAVFLGWRVPARARVVVMPSEGVDRLSVIGPERTTVEVCPLCGLDVRDGEHATSSHQNDPTVEVEYVRADLHRGAVDRARVDAALAAWDVFRGDNNLDGMSCFEEACEALNALRGQ